jgi:DNA polymerase
MDDVSTRFNRLIKDTKAYLEYASLSGLCLAPYSSAHAVASEEPLECNACPFRSSRTGLFKGWGGKEPQLAFVSAAPPAPANGREYTPFTGEAGSQIERIIRAAQDAGDLGDNGVSLSFAIRCAPPSDASPPTLKGAYASCAPLLRKEIEGHGPVVVVAMGAEAFEALTGKTDIGRSRGRFFDFSGIKVVPTYGITELIRDRGLRKLVWEDILFALSALKG